jgi:hypothetical protein
MHRRPTRTTQPLHQWTRKVDGRTVTKVLSPEQRERYQPWFENARRLRTLIAELEALSLHTIEDAEHWRPT